jgi:hypothetical protein
MAPTQLDVGVMILLHPFAREGQRQNEREREREREAERDTRRIAIAAFLLTEPYARLSTQQKAELEIFPLKCSFQYSSISFAPNKVMLCISSAPFQTAKFPLAK